MKILYFTYSYTVHDRRFLRSFLQEGVAVGYLRLTNSFQADSTLPTGVIDLGYLTDDEVYTPEQCLPLLPGLEVALAQFQPHVVQTGPIQTCAFLSALTDFHPMLVMSWGSDMLVAAFKDAYWRSITKFTLRAADHLLCDCETVVRTVKQLLPDSECSTTCFPWGIDLARFTPREGKDSPILARLGWTGQRVFISTRFWEPFYSMDTLLNAFFQAYQANSVLRLIIVGKGSMADYIEEFISNHELRQVVFVPGFVDNDTLPDYYRAADGYISCALNDGSSIALIEAMASGLPVIVADNPSNREWIEDGKHGFFARTGDSRSFAKAILKCTDMSHDQRIRLRNKNRRVAEKRANWRENFRLLVAKLHDLAGLCRA